jgi:ribosomal protein S18 acetylase RimI-like enzyme
VTAAVAIRRALPTDAGEILVVQRAAYVLDAQLYGDPMIKPLVETFEDIQAGIRDAVVIVATVAGRVVGFIRGRLVGRSCHLDRIAVVPDRQGCGIGSTLLTAIEEEVRGVTDEIIVEERDGGQARVRLYRRHGFDENYRDTAGPDVIHIHLDKKIVSNKTGKGDRDRMSGEEGRGDDDARGGKEDEKEDGDAGAPGCSPPTPRLCGPV